nr:3-keto-5-aminohexanoate cleavage protein [Paraburkholderia graminis]
MARNNADQVREIRRFLCEFSLEVATPEEARTMLSLQGAGNISF